MKKFALSLAASSLLAFAPTAAHASTPIPGSCSQTKLAAARVGAAAANAALKAAEKAAANLPSLEASLARSRAELDLAQAASRAASAKSSASPKNKPLAEAARVATYRVAQVTAIVKLKEADVLAVKAALPKARQGQVLANQILAALEASCTWPTTVLPTTLP